jgi:demethylmenaquinone methyltransferase / 2-methoxy-6-polyprenyl-1,4-benzoquinol methylase
MKLEQLESPEKLAPHRPLTEFYRQPERRTQFVGELFDRSARDYNWISRVLSFGTDRLYRKHALRCAGLRPGMKLLDVATGTGLMAQAALDLGLSATDVTGVDPSRGMLAENRRRRSVGLIQGFGELLPFRPVTFDFVSMGYALRHVEDLVKLFDEFHRILRPRGRVLILEITRPGSRFGFALMRFFLKKMLPLLIRFVARHPDSARLIEYYWATIAECVPPEVIVSSLSSAGFKEVERRGRGAILSEYVAARA